jgi:hypothetical protein
MAKLKIHGGDFAKGDGWFYQSSGFVLRDKKGKSEPIPPKALAVADHASQKSIRAIGGNETLVGELERAPVGDKAGAQQIFVACFGDGRLLLASTDPKSYRKICAGHRLYRRSRGAQTR